ncbi:hypothetical protein [Sphingopyxis alaskensis]|uniref:hypothetical protein n=1 Tax=Sphingopyxis alaskensis TaxID=117207 RepID=UPI00059D5F9B|nr:hypothetical protein [Sphingopyxis alaskensis]
MLLLLPAQPALAARMLVAPGWMIESDASRSITVRICSDPANPAATRRIPIERVGVHDSAADPRHGRVCAARCQFSGEDISMTK